MFIHNIMNNRIKVYKIKNTISEKEYAYLCSCEYVVNIKTLPKQTIRLRFQDLKSKVCKPFRK
ncbi:MAG: hypothetical protein WC942_05165 [Clostridia bacterium]|jgi:hypothetical protein